MYARILVPLDGSELAKAALPLADVFARLEPSTLYLVQAVAPDGEAAAARYLEGVVVGLRARGLDAEQVLAHGRPAEVVVQEAERRQADLIVMSTHGRSGPGRWVLGSVADRVLHGATMPLLLVRPDVAAPLKALSDAHVLSAG